MKTNKFIKISIIVLIAFLLFGCENTEKVENGKTVEKNETSNNIVNNNTGSGHKHCTRAATAGSGIDVSLNYDLYYEGDNLNTLYSEEKVTSESKDSLDTYENAYKKIHANYEGLEHYNTSVERDDTSVTSKITIEYDKIDIDALLDIEGEEDNIIENGKAKLSKWLTLAEKFGTKCEDVE